MKRKTAAFIVAAKEIPSSGKRSKRRIALTPDKDVVTKKKASSAARENQRSQLT